MDFRPLTVVVGPNNSGKTSFHKPLLLLKQTLQADDSTAGLVTRGELASVGGYADLVFRHRSPLTLGLSIRFGEHGNERQSRGQDPPAWVELQFRPDAAQRVRLERYEVYDAHGRLLLSRGFAGDRYSIRVLATPFSLRESGADAGRTAYLRRVENAIRDQRPAGFTFPTASLVGALFTEPGERRASRFPEAAMRYLAIVNEANQGLERVLASLSYVGPLREAFDRFYQPLGHVPAEVGVTGRQAPDIIIARHREAEFQTWLTKWLWEFGFRGGFSVSDATSGVHRIEVRATEKGTPVNIADSGFGLSQVLPFIVHGIHAAPGSLLLAEQPEIHLNPKLQIKLADLFGAMVKRGRNILVETHSEHFVSRLRYLVATRRLAPTDVSVLYVEKRGWQSTVREVKVEDDGSIAEGVWPAGFFDEAVSEAVSLMRAQVEAHAR
ncbi:MAG TPA: DUF3696 domain-containing protein [Candidatus Limnocylindria bacterium]|nr:DUF3696 domain-containing protein [Candidatus Limnocylindria bacterium]